MVVDLMDGYFYGVLLMMGITYSKYPMAQQIQQTPAALFSLRRTFLFGMMSVHTVAIHVISISTGNG